ncbi:MAG: hypothetical protein QNJ38_09545 [Prochloraceae cyanobacterium]|nr:hypothetical protein [Prochloraceae cyanobacterium]
MNDRNITLWFNFFLLILLIGTGFFIGLWLHSVISLVLRIESETLKILLTSIFAGVVSGLLYNKLHKK